MQLTKSPQLPAAREARRKTHAGATMDLTQSYQPGKADRDKDRDRKGDKHRNREKVKERDRE